MRDFALFYYTNNLISPELLKATLGSACELSVKNNAELILTSHFPITDEYTVKDLGNEYYGTFRPNLYDYLVRDSIVDIPDNAKAFVVGKLPYSLKSIIKQILLSIDNCDSDNVVFMEHDCFYPSDYLKAIDSISDDIDIAFVDSKRCFLDEIGFFKFKAPTILLSGFSGKKEVMKEVFENKLRLLDEGKKISSVEPYVDYGEMSQVINHSEEIKINNSTRVDSFLDGTILDIRHQFNSSANVLVKKEYNGHDSYWGDADKYKNMIKYVDVADEDKSFWDWGTIQLDY